jgi:hypothetical protein
MGFAYLVTTLRPWEGDALPLGHTRNKLRYFKPNDIFWSTKKIQAKDH